MSIFLKCLLNLFQHPHQNSPGQGFSLIQASEKSYKNQSIDPIFCLLYEETCHKPGSMIVMVTFLNRTWW